MIYERRLVNTSSTSPLSRRLLDAALSIVFSGLNDSDIFLLLLYIAFLTTWPFYLCCYEHGRVFLSRGWLYAVRSAFSATAGFFQVMQTTAPKRTQRLFPHKCSKKSGEGHKPPSRPILCGRRGPPHTSVASF